MNVIITETQLKNIVHNITLNEQQSGTAGNVSGFEKFPCIDNLLKINKAKIEGNQKYVKLQITTNDFLNKYAFFSNGRVNLGSNNVKNYSCSGNDIVIDNVTYKMADEYSNQEKPAASGKRLTLNDCAQKSMSEIDNGKSLFVGCKSDAVKELQAKLKMPTNYQTGYFGNITKQAVIDYQIAKKGGYKNNPDGIVGPLTYAILKNDNQVPEFKRK